MMSEEPSHKSPEARNGRHDILDAEISQRGGDYEDATTGRRSNGEKH